MPLPGRPRGDRRPHSADPPLSPGPFTEVIYPDSDPMDPRELHMGNPSAPGPSTPNIPRHGLPSPGNGQPGMPHTRPAPGHHDGMPGMSPTGPRQPGAQYLGEIDEIS